MPGPLGDLGFELLDPSRSPCAKAGDLGGDVVNEPTGEMRDHLRTAGVNFCDFMPQ